MPASNQSDNPGKPGQPDPRTTDPRHPSSQDLHQRLADCLLARVPAYGKPIGNTALWREIEAELTAAGDAVTQDDYWQVHAQLVSQGLLLKGQGRGGSVRRANPTPSAPTEANTLPPDTPPPVPPATQAKPPDSTPPHTATSDDFNLAAPQPPTPPDQPPGTSPGTGTPRRNRSSATPKGQAQPDASRLVIGYTHPNKRLNNPEVGLVNPTTDPEGGKQRWAYNPHLDPALHFDSQRGAIERLIDDALASDDLEQMREALEELKRLQAPYLNWAGKAERTSFEIDTVSLHVHERIDPATILRAVRKGMNEQAQGKQASLTIQPSLFENAAAYLPRREAIDFYRHERDWSNRLIAGDSLLVMTSLLQKESMAGRVQMIYIDPPYGIKYGSNFQPFVGKRDVKDRNDADLTQEPEMLKAFRDTWELGIHSYLTYLRDRLLLAHELLNEKGSVFVQIGDENLHLVRTILDELFGPQNFFSQITVKKLSPLGTSGMANVTDYIVWYAKDRSLVKFRPIYDHKATGSESRYDYVELPDGKRRKLTRDEIENIDTLPINWHLYCPQGMLSSGYTETCTFDLELFRASIPANKKSWRTNQIGIDRLKKANRLELHGTLPYLVAFHKDNPLLTMDNIWADSGSASTSYEKVYVVQTPTSHIQRCMLMATDPGDLILDPTCGSGTTAYVAEKWGRRWITCDTSRVAVTLAKMRLMTASFDYYALKYPHEGLKAGFIYKTVPHVTLKSIANNPDIDSLHERYHPAIEAALADLNSALQQADFYLPPFRVTEGGRKGQELGFRWGATLLEWEVPFDLPLDWLPPDTPTPAPGPDPQPAATPASATTPAPTATPDPTATPAAPEPHPIAHHFARFHAARQTMQRHMDAAIAAHAEPEVLYDQPAVEKDKLRITGPFTVEAVPFPSVKSLDQPLEPDQADASIARTRESGRQHHWRDELLKTGIRGKGGQMLRCADLEALPSGTGTDDGEPLVYLHATGHLESGERVVVSFGPEHGALEQRQVSNALNEASLLFPVPKMLLFCAFAFDPEAAKDIDAIRGITALKAQMNTDLLTEDLKKARASNQSFWLMGQPDVEKRRRPDGLWEVEVHGFDYFDTIKGELVSGGKGKIALWLLDTDYDERSLYPRQVFFPLADQANGWAKLRRDLRAGLDEARLDAFRGTVSLPFAAGDNRKIAVKIVDDRGIESLKVMALS